MDWRGILTGQAGGRMGKACFLGPWRLGRADDGGGSCLLGGPQNAEPAYGLGQFLTLQSLRRDPGMSRNHPGVEAGGWPQDSPRQLPGRVSQMH